MTHDLTDFAYQLFRVLNPGRVHYLSVPITSGLTEVELMCRYNCTREQLRQDHKDEFRREVIEPNERQSAKYAQMLRERDSSITVINPGALFVPTWGQDEYMAFWVAIIRAEAATLVFPPETIYSTGGRTELCLALKTQVPVVDLNLQPLTAQMLQNHLVGARNHLKMYWDQNQINAYLPYIDFQSLVPYPAANAPLDAGAVAQFGAFAADHNLRSQSYQHEQE